MFHLNTYTYILYMIYKDKSALKKYYIRYTVTKLHCITFFT